MSSTSKHQSTDYALNIGCEIETLLSWSDPNHNPAAKNPTEFVSLLCNKFNKFNNSKGKTAMKLTSNMEDTTITEVTYATWTVTGDSTLKKEKKDVHYYPLEIVSPIMAFKERGIWRDQIGDMFNTLSIFSKFKGNESCGFHVHLSPARQKDPKWKLEELQHICTAIIHFERAMAALLPTHRNGSFWAKTHRNNAPGFKGKSVADCIKLIKACEDINELVMLMNDGSIRYYAWNFQNLSEQKTGTIEWRQPAAITTAQGCKAWMELAITFVQAARTPGVDCTTFSATVEGLRGFLKKGSIEKLSNVEVLDAILNDDKIKTGSVELITPDRIPSAEELIRKVQEDERKNLLLRKLDMKLKEEKAKAAAAKKAAEAAAAGSS